MKKETLSDKIVPCNICRNYLWEDDVKEFIKRLKDKADVKIAEHTLDIGEDLLIIKRKDLNKLLGDKFL